MASVRITYTKSSTGYREDQAQTIKALGLRRLGQSVRRPDTPALRGMLRKVAHLVEVRAEEA
jgi:large subunit ribosomal protein L30